MFNELMVRLFGGASLALLLLAGLFTSARAVADPPNGHFYCIAVYGCNVSNCPSAPPCGSDNCFGFGCVCLCGDYDMEEQCGCRFP
jgi:hypothetical protein